MLEDLIIDWKIISDTHLHEEKYMMWKQWNILTTHMNFLQTVLLINQFKLPFIVSVLKLRSIKIIMMK